MISHAPLVLFEFDHEGSFTLIEGSALAKLGYRPGTLVGRSVFEVYARYPECLTLVRRALLGEAVTGLVEVAGRIFDLALTPRHDAHDRLCRVVGVAHDVTERHELTKAQRETEARLRDFARASSDWLWETDAEHRFTMLSERFEQVLGMAPAKVLGRRRWDNRVADDPADGDWDEHLRLLHAGQPFRDFRFAFRDAQGRRRVVRVSGVPVFDPDGTFLGHRGVGREVTQDYEAERRLQESEQRLRSLVENMRGILFCRGAAGGQAHGYDGQGVAVYGRDAYAIGGSVDASGHSLLERWYAAIDPEDRPAYFAAEAARKLEHVPYSLDFRIRHPDTQELRWVREVAWTVTDEATGVTQFDSYIIDITELKRTGEALRESEGRFRSLVTNLRNIIFMRVTPRGDDPDVDDGSVQLYGLDAHRITGLADEGQRLDVATWRRLIHTDDGPAYAAAARGRVDRHEPFDLHYRIIHPRSGEIRWLHEVAWVVPDSTTERTFFDSYILDVTDQKRAAATLAETTERYRRLIEGAPVAILIYREERCIYANPAALTLLGAESARDLLGRRMVELAGEPSRLALLAAIEGLPSGRPAVPFEMRCRRVDGRNVIVEASAAAIVEAGHPAIQLVLVDLTARKRAEANIFHMAHHDALTGLPNRLLLMDRLSQAVVQARRERQKLALMILDLDGFKEVNDTLGHAAGDELLRLVAQRIRGVVRSSDTLARLGGDEFAVMQAGLRSNAGAGTLAAKIVEELSRPFVIDNQEVNAAASIGISLFPEDGDSPGTLLQHADLALYSAKDSGRNRYCFFEPNLNASAQTRRQLANELRSAMEHGELTLEFQPQIEMRSRAVVGTEALLRWNHPRRGRVPPAEFVPIAESTGLIRPLGAWVLREACAQSHRWERDGRILPVAVNVSAAQLRDPDFGLHVSAALSRHGLMPSRLCLELTESLLIDPQLDGIGLLLERLARQGVEIAIDDFGTGFSSLLNLKRLPVHLIKIDRSFVRGIGRDAESEAIIQATVSLAHSLGKGVIAEGVETEEQHEFLAALGCDQAQGYLYGAPQPPDRICELAGRLSARPSGRDTIVAEEVAGSAAPVKAIDRAPRAPLP